MSGPDPGMGIDRVLSGSRSLVFDGWNIVYVAVKECYKKSILGIDNTSYSLISGLLLRASGLLLRDATLQSYSGVSRSPMSFSSQVCHTHKHTHTYNLCLFHKTEKACR